MDIESIRNFFTTTASALAIKVCWPPSPSG